MVILEYDDFEVDFCLTCRGVWLDAGELEQVLHGASPAALLDGEAGRKGQRRCPRCTRKMRVRPLVAGGPDIDACPAGCGLWFDQGELRATVRQHLPGEAAGQIVQRLTAMFGNETMTHEPKGTNP
jgi:Zn-finger nucleic acid-binding protein